MLLKRRGQSTLEYAIVIAVVVAALLAIQIYMKRGVQGRLKSSTDDIGEQFDARKTSSNYTTKREGTTVEIVESGKTSTYADGTHKSVPDEVKRQGSETVEAWKTGPEVPPPKE